MMKPQQVEEPDGTRHVIAPIIVPKLSTAAKCALPVCESCLLVISKKGSPGVSTFKAVTDKEGIPACDKYELGDFVSTYQFVVHTPGILPPGYGRECCQNRFHGCRVWFDLG